MSTVTNQVTESEVVLLWQRQLQRQRRLTDSAGLPVEVIYPGRPNDGKGGDFRDAVVDFRSERKSGCIEIHTRPGNWLAHGHHRDPEYNRVILHVALKNTSGHSEETVLQNGQVVPTILLKPNSCRHTSQKLSDTGLPCRGVIRRWSQESLTRYLDRAGDLRFSSKAEQYQRVLSRTGDEQSLYEGFLEALGYAKNQLPFRKLARQAPLQLAEEIAREELAGEDILLRLQAFLLGRAGLLPSQRAINSRGEEMVDNLERSWLDFSSGGSLSWREWELYKVRPDNHPVRRIAALSCLLYRCRKEGWFRHLMKSVRQSALDRSRIKLESAIRVRSPGYWTHYYDFDRPGTHISPVLLGRERAAEIAINILLPFAWTWGRMTERPELDCPVRELYAHYPRLEANSVEQHMLKQLSLDYRQVNSARRQQGLIHIYKTLCTQGKCDSCELAKY